jgi:exodeoxyribonuclease VII large subunit
MSMGVSRLLDKNSAALDSHRGKIVRIIESRFSEYEKFLNSSMNELSSRGLRAVELNEAELARLSAKLGAMSPLSVLGRGYSICRDAGGTVVRSSSAILPGDRVSSLFKDGSAEAEILKTLPDAVACLDVNE